jgi:hypothetical protein
MKTKQSVKPTSIKEKAIKEIKEAIKLMKKGSMMSF